jgi:opacity protein-like surface antigen
MFFAGVGAGLGLITSGEQSVVQQAPSNIFNRGVLVTTGQAGGPPVTPYLGAKADWVPLAQLGYFRHFGETDWLWGAKFSYIYQDKSLTEAPLLVPQTGSSSNPAIANFSGLAVTRSYEVFLDHQFILTPFVGRSFDNGFVYVGAGPSLSRVGTRLNDVVGFASFPPGALVSGVVDVSGAPQSFAQSRWTWGVAASVGATYFVTARCFLDLSYTFSQSLPGTFHAESPFHNEIYSPVVFEGTLIGDQTAKASTHSVTLSINMGF